MKDATFEKVVRINRNPKKKKKFYQIIVLVESSLCLPSPNAHPFILGSWGWDWSLVERIVIKKF